MPKYKYAKGEFELPDDLNDTRAVLVEDLDIEEYHDLGNVAKHGKNAIFSKSQIALMHCPAKFKHKYLDGRDDEEKDHLNIGNAVHTLALEPELFKSRFYVITEGVKRDKRTQAYKDEIEKAAGRKMLTATGYAEVKEMADAVVGSKVAQLLLNAPGKIEPSIFWTDPVTKLRCRCRPDLLRDDALIVDIKTAASAEPDKFFRSAFDFHYDMSAGMTSEGVKALLGKEPTNYVFLVIESKAPCIIEAFESNKPFDPEDPSKLTYQGAGEWRFRQNLEKLEECLRRHIWPGYSGKIGTMSVPRYAMKKLEE